MRSILTTDKICFRCGTRANLHKHHVFGGYGNRSLSEQYGLWVYLCAEHHNMGNDSVHQNKDKILSLGYSAVSEARKNCYFGDKDYLSERGYKDAVAQIVGIEV